jgi:biotin carboxylase
MWCTAPIWRVSSASEHNVRFAFIESNTTGTGRIAIERLLAAGHDVTLFARTPSLYPFLDRLSAVRLIEAETNDVSRLAPALDREVGEHGRLDGLLTFSTFYVETTARLAARCALRHLNARTAALCHHKPAFRRAMQAAGAAGPAFWIATSHDEAVHAARATSYPCVVKPSAESGSTNVHVVDTPAALVRDCEQLLALTTNARGQASPGDCLIEELLQGPEYSVETLTVRGETTVVGVTAKHLSAPPYFVETGHDFPADVPPAVARRLVDAAREALDVVGYDHGPAHIEIKLTAAGPVVIEVNPRLAGGMIPELVRLASGVDLIQAVLSIAAGVPAQLTPTREQNASIRFITAPRAGWLVRTNGLDAARRVDLVTEVAFDRSTPSQVSLPRHAGDRLGYVVACGRHRAAVGAAAQRALTLAQRGLDIDDRYGVPPNGGSAHSASESTH